MKRTGLVLMLSSAFLALLVPMIWSVPAHAQVCESRDPQLALQYLRRLSLDLRGEVPSLEELQQVAREGVVAESLIDKMLASEGFLHQVREYHRELLWPNVNDLTLANVAWRLSADGVKAPIYISSQGRKRKFRGGNVSCLNEPAVIKAGVIQCKKAMFTESNGKQVEVCQEGYVKVKPYWAPTTELKVCAFDAQTTLKVPRGNNLFYDCSTSATSEKCGCGPGMRWCMNTTVMREITNALGEQLLRYVAGIIKGKKSYTEVLLGKEIEINGPIAHYLSYQTSAAGSLLYARAEQNYTIPAVAFHEKTRWVKVLRKTLHAGVLTLPGFLLKFASNRGRANRFYNSFLCKPFQAPAKGLPPASDRCHEEPNLMKRCGCKYCHVSVEPAAAYWGRWAEAGLAPLNPAEFPAELARCKNTSSARDATCRRLYFVSPGHPDEERYRGKLLSYVFANEQMTKNIEQGPQALATSSIENGTFGQCATQKAWIWLMGTEPLAQQSERISTLSEAFKKGRYNFAGLIKSIVMSPEYKQGRLLNQ